MFGNIRTQPEENQCSGIIKTIQLYVRVKNTVTILKKNSKVISFLTEMNKTHLTKTLSYFIEKSLCQFLGMALVISRRS
jgi:hypothetical protein